MVKRIISIIIAILRQIRMLPIRNKFGKCGKWVTFGRLNRIVGGKNIVIGDHCSFGNNLRIEAICHYGGGKYNPSIIIGI